VVKSIYDVNAESQRLKASLITVTGSLEAANKAWAGLEQFASTTPYELEQSIEAFTRMKSLGLNPTRDALTSFGNTAASMGKSLNQMIEAVADASTMEFERLKEFGIKAKQQADTVSFTFQGVTTTVGKNSQEIVDYLNDIGNTAFAGAMERQMATIGGAASNLGDNMGALARAIGEAGANEGFSAAIGFASKQVAALSNFIRAGGIGESLTTLKVWFVGTGESISQSMESAVGYFGTIWSDWFGWVGGALKDFIEFFKTAMKALPANVKAVVQIMAVEFGYLVDRAKLYGQQIAWYMDPRNWFKDAPKAAWEAQTQAITQAYSDSIVAIMDARDASLRAFDDQLAKLEEVSAGFEGASAGALEFGDISAMSGEKAATGAGEAASAVAKAAEETEALTEKTDAAQKSFERGIERFRDVVGDYFQTMLVDGKLSMTSLLDSFKAMIAEMIATAAANRILVGLKLAGGATGASAGGMAQFASSAAGAGKSLLSGAGSFLSNPAWGTLNAASGMYQGIGNFAYDAGFNQIGDAAMGKAGSYIDGTMGQGLTNLGLDIGGGLAGSWLSNKAFGQTSGIGNALGGVAGSLLIPIPGLGTAVGSFLGGGLESLFGGKNNGDNPGRGQIDLAAGTSSVAGVGKTFDQANVDFVQGMSDYAMALSEAVGGSSAKLDIERGRDYMRIGKDRFSLDQEAEFIETLIDRVVWQADDLSGPLKRLIDGFDGTSTEVVQFADSIRQFSGMLEANPVDVALADFMAGQENAAGGMMAVYQRQMDSIRELAGEFDGSLEATQALSGALAQNQQLAYQLAAAVMQVSSNIESMTERTAAQFREAGMTEQERLATWRATRDQLTRSLTEMTDPEQIQSVTAEINRLSQAMFNALGPEQQMARAEAFATYTEKVNAIAQNRLDKTLDRLQATQEAQNERLNDMLMQAARTQLEAAQRMEGAAARIEAAAVTRTDAEIAL
jgi:hypothetical protein